jgi:RNA polymerase sigma factor (TIGR02999 family)
MEMVDAQAYERLRKSAGTMLRRETAACSWDPADLLHEAFVRLARSQAPVVFRDASHFHAVALLTMKRILIDRARSARAFGGARCELLDVESTAAADAGRDAIAVRDALRQLARQEKRLYLVVQMRFFLGFELNEIAAALSLSTRTIKRDWTCARIWLRQILACDTSTAGRPTMVGAM